MKAVVGLNARLKFDHTFITNMQGLHGVHDTASNIACVKSAAYDVASQKAVWKKYIHTTCIFLRKSLL